MKGAEKEQYGKEMQLGGQIGYSRGLGSAIAPPNPSPLSCSHQPSQINLDLNQ